MASLPITAWPTDLPPLPQPARPRLVAVEASAPPASAPARLSALEWSVVALAERDTIASLREPGRIAAALKLDGQEVVGGETRIRQSPDGHFWVRVTVGGVKQRMLVDSGATVTALSSRTAAEMGLDPRPGIVPVLLTTANGTIRAQTVTVPELRLGSIVARDLSAVVSPAFGNVNVVGMNFLSRLKSWRVEDNMLILVPHHPQESAS